MEDFATQLLTRLHGMLVERGAVDERFPECPDVEGKWTSIAQAYLPDGVREFANYPGASLGWMMFIGMAVAKYWDADWEIYGNITDLYAYLRDKRGYDSMDEYILDEVLRIHGHEAEACTELVGDCSQEALHMLHRENFEPGTAEAFKAYVSCLQCLYQLGMAVQLKAMGYHMTALA